MIKKNIVVISICLVLIVILGIGFSYSLWNISVSQDTTNIAESKCFDLSISNQENSINLENAYPISNNKGKSLTPFTFTVTNTCDITAQYSVDLEVLKESTLPSEFIDVMFEGNINLLSSYDSTDKVNSNSIESRKLITGILKSQESKDNSLRLWIDDDTTLEDLNNENKTFKSKIVVVGKPINYEGDTVFNFDYTGAEQSFTVPVSGIYKLETWGAQGGSYNTAIGGLGGFSKGNVYINKKANIYINVGGSGVANSTVSANGGYNGGGSSSYQPTFENNRYFSSGGGATHISINSGLLYKLNNSINEILIVSGGGGGSYFSIGNETYANGGNAGGYVGGDGDKTSEGWGTAGTGGTQTIPGLSICDDNTCNSYNNKLDKGNYGIASFGLGGSNSVPSCGGGGGFYGGGASVHVQSGGGGSSYIGNLILTDKVMYCYNCEESSEENTKTISTTCSEETPTSYCVKKGNGYARITLISIDE